MENKGGHTLGSSFLVFPRSLDIILVYVTMYLIDELPCGRFLPIPATVVSLSQRLIIPPAGLSGLSRGIGSVAGRSVRGSSEGVSLQYGLQYIAALSSHIGNGV